MGAGHPECPERLDAIEDRLLMSGLDVALERREATAASMADLELAHGRMHLASLRGLSDNLRDEIKAGGPTHAQVDPDTSINTHSWDAILMAAGAAIDATDAVMAGEMPNAFCAVRPPGHHATRNQAMGFCFVNNVAVAAKYALERHGLKRVAIIDFDVHHGNGTEDIVAGDDRILMCSFYQHPFYPACEHSTAANLVNVPVPAYTKGMDIRELIDMMLDAPAGRPQAADDLHQRRLRCPPRRRHGADGPGGAGLRLDDRCASRKWPSATPRAAS